MTAPRKGEVIAVTGKGGVGKTTVAALIIRHLRAHATGPILALDADPVANLATVLGIPVEMSIGDLREDMLKSIKDFPPGMSKESYVEAGLHQLITETPKVDLITMGRGEGSGCYCFVNNLLKKFSDQLLPSYEWVVMDNEAGLEHLSRHTATRIDHLIVVVNENPLSLDCAKRINEILDEMKRDIRHRYFVVNAVRDSRIDAVMAKMADLAFTCLGAIPRDEALDDAIFAGQSLYDLGDTPAVAAIDEIMQKIGAD